MRNQATVLVLLELLLASPGWAKSPIPATTEPPCTALRPGNGRPSEGIGILHSARVLRRLVEDAVELWAGCEEYGTGFPPLVIGREGTQSIEVKLYNGRSAGSRCGAFVGRTIFLYSFARDSTGRLRSCGSRANGLAHELGHVLALLDAPDTDGCRDHAMAYVDVTDRNRRVVQPEECRAVAERWVTPTEQDPARSSVSLTEIER